MGVLLDEIVEGVSDALGKSLVLDIDDDGVGLFLLVVQDFLGLGRREEVDQLRLQEVAREFLRVLRLERGSEGRSMEIK